MIPDPQLIRKLRETLELPLLICRELIIKHNNDYEEAKKEAIDKEMKRMREYWRSFP